jgi:hypothetical protein
VITPELQRLREQRTRRMTAIAGGIEISSIYKWAINPSLETALEAALSGNTGGVADDLHGRTRQNLQALARAASWAACLSRAGIRDYKFSHLLRRAEAAGAKDDLLAYLSPEGAGAGARFRRCGLITDNLFCPTEAMLRFREVAGNAMAELKVWSLKKLPGFDQWFVDWTTPRPFLGRRLHPEVKEGSRDSYTGKRFGGTPRVKRAGEGLPELRGHSRDAPLFVCDVGDGQSLKGNVATRDRTKFSDTENAILDHLLKHGPQTGPQLAKELHYPYDGNLRSLLSNLVRLELLGNDNRGYYCL